MKQPHREPPENSAQTASVQRRQVARPLAPPLHLSTVWQCADLEHAQRAMDGEDYVYQRERHPNADLLAAELGRWHGAPRAAVTPSGMAALSLAAVSQLRQGDHVVLSDQLYGKTQVLWRDELGRFGVQCTLANALDLDAVRRAMRENTRLLVVETIANPMLQVADLAALADTAHQAGARLLVDNTFASPWLCRPLELGADWVMESVTKMINGHSDVLLGALLGPEDGWERVVAAQAAWGWSAAPLQCWLAHRGMQTLDVRMERACRNAAALADFLGGLAGVGEVLYPGRPQHPDHELAARQFAGRFGTMISIRIAGQVSHLLRECGRLGLPFAPSLGEVQTTLSHPASTSHRGLEEGERQRLGITPQVIRVSVGIEPLEELQERFRLLLADDPSN